MKGLDVAEFKRWWQQRPVREKLMLSACSLGVLLALGDSLAISPLEKQLRQLRSTEEQLQASWDQLQQRRKGQTAQDKALRELEASLRLRLQAAQARVSELNPDMADTARLPDVLRTVVATMGDTRLLELTFADDATTGSINTGTGTGTGTSSQAGLAGAALAALSAVAPGLAPGAAAPKPTAPGTAAATANVGTTPPTTTTTTTITPAAATTAAAPRRIYHLPVTLKVSGSWTELTSLLNQVQSQAPALQWQTLSLDSNDWPAIQLTLRAHVRSLQPRWGTAP